MPTKQELNETAGNGGEATMVKERICPDCAGKMVQRTSRFGPFWGCSNYPKCKHLEKT